MPELRRAPALFRLCGVVLRVIKLFTLLHNLEGKVTNIISSYCLALSLSSISWAVWQAVQGVQKIPTNQSSPSLPSIPYTSLVLLLNREVAAQGRQQLSRHQTQPSFPTA